MMSLFAKLRRLYPQKPRPQKKVQAEKPRPKTPDEEKGELLDFIGRSSTLAPEDKQNLVDLVNRTYDVSPHMEP